MVQSFTCTHTSTLTHTHLPQWSCFFNPCGGRLSFLLPWRRNCFDRTFAVVVFNATWRSCRLRLCTRIHRNSDSQTITTNVRVCVCVCVYVCLCVCERERERGKKGRGHNNICACACACACECACTYGFGSVLLAYFFALAL